MKTEKQLYFTLRVHNNKADIKLVRLALRGMNLAELYLVTFKKKGKKQGMSKNYVICTKED